MHISQQKPLQQSNPLMGSNGSDMSLSIQMPAFPNMAMSMQQQAPKQQATAQVASIPVPSMQSLQPQPGGTKAPTLTRTVSTIVRVGSSRIRRFG